jgi:hypothetical protein
MTKKSNFISGITVSVLLILGLFLYFKFMQVSPTNDIDSEMKNQVSQKIQAWIEYYRSKDAIMMSSAPYSYIENDKFQEIENLGPEYLPYILREIENEPSAVFALWGLNGIAKVKDLPIGDSDPQCVSFWNNYIENLPSKLNELKEDLYSTNNTEKIKLKTQEIVDLGYPVLPLIMEEDNIKMKEVEKALFKQENIKINDEETINKKINAYKKLMKSNHKIKYLDSYKFIMQKRVY